MGHSAVQTKMTSSLN